MSGTVRKPSEPHPVGWELAVALGVAVPLLSLALLPVGQGVAAWVTGRGWVWPHGRSGVVVAAEGLLIGRPGRAVTILPIRRLPGADVMYGTIGVVELVYWSVVAVGVVVWWRAAGPGVRDGMADRREAVAVLGLSQLRSVRAVIRPDLCADVNRSGAVGGP